jgi:integrase
VRCSLDAGSRAVPQAVGHLPEQRQRGRPKRRPIIPRSSGAMPSPAIAANSVVPPAWQGGREYERPSERASAAGQEERAEERDLRVDRGLVQPAPAALDARVPPTHNYSNCSWTRGRWRRKLPSPQESTETGIHRVRHASSATRAHVSRARRTTWNNGGRKLSCPLDGRTLKQSYVRHLVRRLADKAVVERRVHPYALRHTHSAEWLARAHP